MFTKRPVDIIRFPRVPPEQLKHPNEKPVGAILPLINAHYKTGDYPKRSSRLRQSHEINPNPPKMQMRLGRHGGGL